MTNTNSSSPLNGNGHQGEDGNLIDTPQPVEEPVEVFETLYLEPERVHFCHEGENLTYIAVDGTFYPRVTLMRCFPMSAQNNFISVRTPDQEMERGEELGILEDFTALDEISRLAVERELRLHYLVPAIQRVLDIREEFGFLYWTVETDRGNKEFIMRDSLVNSTRQISKVRWLMIDINQTRYEINDLEKLDEHSRQLLEKNLLL